MKADEIKYYGFNACLALWRNRAADIIRVYAAEERLKELGPLLRWCAAHKKAYHVVSPDDLAKVAASTHHEGVVILARIPRRLDDAALLERAARAPERDVMLLLDDVQNPHNIGALLRTAAHFGASALIGARASLPALSPSAMRVSEGGMEHVAMAALDTPVETAKALARLGYRLLGTSGTEGDSLYGTELPPRCILALGNEITGLSPRLAARVDGMLRIPGSGAVESLNVGVAGALVLGEWWRQHRR
jgi:TrmH RNA methyltransferase